VKEFKLTAPRYLFNPFTIATCIARPTSVLTNTFILFAIANAATARSLTFVLALSFASYLSLYPILFFPPLAILCYDQRAVRSKQPENTIAFTLSHLTGLGGAISALLYLSSLITGSWQFLASTYGTPLLLPDLTPNVGLWWYFFIEMFDSFREFFLGVFWLHMASYVGGLCIRLRKQPLFATVAMTGIIAIFQPYPSIADSALFLGLVPLYRHIFPCKFDFQSNSAQPFSETYHDRSDALLFRCNSGNHVRNTTRTRLLPPLDLCRLRKRQLFLRDYIGVEFWADTCDRGYALCRTQR
jgi:phosphatidylinositol glycan class U